MTENRRVKIFIVWSIGAALMVALQAILHFDATLVQILLEKTGTAALILIGGLTATDAVYTYKNGVTK
jgi:ABC-type phosphate transport system auxiliary subunit